MTKGKSKKGKVRYVPPYDKREQHLPGMNYTGPGTNVWRRMSAGVKPIDALDQLAFTHDLFTETRGPNRSNGERKKLRAADKDLLRGAKRLLKKGYQPAWKAIAVINAMEFMLKTGIRGR